MGDVTELGARVVGRADAEPRHARPLEYRDARGIAHHAAAGVAVEKRLEFIDSPARAAFMKAASRRR
ncbi:hypothetical protein [Nocardia fluminea]|uniref:hypothetical protein n=1 Tax=Nocardia fluminea TaxID=134984 RepID=UPI003D0F18DA